MLRGALQWALAVALGLPIMIAAIFVWLPLSVPLWAVVWCRTRKIAPRAQSAAGAKPHPLEVRPKGWVFCYVTCLALTWHAFIRLWAKVARPQVVFVVYHNTIHTLGAFFCLHTGKVRARAPASHAAGSESRGARGGGRGPGSEGGAGGVRRARGGRVRTPRARDYGPASAGRTPARRRLAGTPQPQLEPCVAPD